MTNLTKGQKVGVAVLVSGTIGGGIALAWELLKTTPPPVTPEFTVEQATWDAAMPFAPGSTHDYDFSVQNLNFTCNFW